MKIIDSHTNLGWDAQNIRKKQFPQEQSTQQLLEKMDQHEISQAIIVPFPSPNAQFEENLFWYDQENILLTTAAYNSKRLIPFPAVNPADEDSVKSIQKLAESIGIKGVKFSHQTLMGFSIDKLIGHPVMKIIQKHHLILMLHIGTGKEPGAKQIHVTLDYAIKVAKQYPQVTFIFCHLGRLHWSLFDAFNLDNVYFDTAGISLWNHWRQFIAAEPVAVLKNTTPREVIEKLVNFGYGHKILFGSDEPYASYREAIAIMEKAKISPAAKEKIFHGNITRLLLSAGSKGGGGGGDAYQKNDA